MKINSHNPKIKLIAEYIALQYDTLITPLSKIIEDEELPVFYDNYENVFDGLTMFDNGRFCIHINTNKGNYQDSPRGRFTLAHELGHFFIDAHRIGIKTGLISIHPSQTNIANYNKIEREADYFAGCLLMPEAKFKNRIFSLSHKPCPELIGLLKKDFHVSFTACAMRYADIGNCEIMIVFAEDKIIKWKYCSEDFPYKNFINDNIVPTNMVMGEYFYQNKTDTINRIEKVWAIDCFKYLNNKSINDLFYEYCITYKNQALSILWRD